MGKEINLLEKYPKTKRQVQQRALTRTEEDVLIARQFGREFFDGERRHGYGGFQYHPRFWHPVVPDFISYFSLTQNSSVLDVGCSKGFMLHDIAMFVPGICTAGIDISSYAIEHAMDSQKANLLVGNATNLPYPDKSFDVVLSINTVHNLERCECIQALKEIQRVSKKHAYVVVDAYQTDAEKEAIFAWALTAKTILHVQEWKELFLEAGYDGDYYWFTP